MKNANPSALLRSLIVYAVCVPLAIVVGFSLVDLSQYNLHDTQSLVIIGVLAGTMLFPLLMKWHYPILLFSWGLSVTLFFLPGKPNLFMPMVVASFTISLIERILNRNRPFLPAGGARWALVALAVVVYITAKLTGGFGLRSLGSDVYGGKKYISLAIGIMSFFALTARQIPKEKANFYIGLFFAGSLFAIVGDFYPICPPPLQFIYYLFPPSGMGMDAMGDFSVELGKTRLNGTSGAAGALVFWMLARHGIRGTFFTNKLWRPIVFFFGLTLIFLGGYRSSIMSVAFVCGVLFILERLYRTGMMMAVVLVGIGGAVALVPLAPHLPYTAQRSLAFLPLNISVDARMDAEDSSEWRIAIWQALLPQIPKYLLLGKGYAFTQETFNESMGQDATFRTSIDAADNPLALSSDFHNGPISVLLPFGVWGAIAWLWFMIAGYRVVWLNYRYGDPAFQHLNRFFIGIYMVRVFMFFFIFGDLTGDVANLGSVIGLSIAINGGVRQPKPQSAARPAPVQQPWTLPIRPAIR